MADSYPVDMAESVSVQLAYSISDAVPMDMAVADSDSVIIPDSFAVHTVSDAVPVRPAYADSVAVPQSFSV